MFRLFVLASIVAVSACTSTGAETVQPVDPPTIDLRNTAKLSDVVRELGEERVVYVGEVHTAFEDHLVQLSVLQHLHRQDPNLAIGVEWFQQPFQEHLDAYIEGVIDEAAMLKATEYFSRWSFDYRLYRPIMRYAREHGIPVLALNAPAELTRAIGSDGREGLAEDLRGYLPRSYGVAGPDYETRLRRAFDAHPERGRSFERFLDVQLTWDESMAERAADFLRDNPDHRLVVFAGRGHIDYGHGIPSRVERRSGIDGTIVLTAHGAEVDRAAADYLVFAGREDLPEQGLMGVLLETEGRDGVKVVGVSEDGGAAAAGMEEDDVIVAIGDSPIGDYADVKVVLMDKVPGERVSVTILRDSLLFDAEESILEIELRGRGRGVPEGHP